FESRLEIAPGFATCMLQFIDFLAHRLYLWTQGFDLLIDTGSDFIQQFVKPGPQLIELSLHLLSIGLVVGHSYSITKIEGTMSRCSTLPRGRVRVLADSFGGSMLLDRITDPRRAQPRGTGSDGDHGKPSAIKAGGRKGLGRVVQ